MKDKKIKCDGGCEKHEGEIKKVRIKHHNHDWGYFNYCDIAIAEDISRGLFVGLDEEI